MNMLCGYHSQSREICQWVVDTVSEDTDNLTVRMWVQQSRERLQSLNEGPETVSIGVK